MVFTSIPKTFIPKQLAFELERILAFRSHNNESIITLICKSMQQIVLLKDLGYSLIELT